MTETNSITVGIRILDKDYQVHCSPDEQEALLGAARDLDQRMRDVRRSGNVIGLERIAVMVALNLSYELMQTNGLVRDGAAASADLGRLDQKLDQALLDLE
jgi:cell division protein ZapA